MAKHKRTVSDPEPEPSAAPEDGLAPDDGYIPAAAEAPEASEDAVDDGAGRSAEDEPVTGETAAEDPTPEADDEPVELDGRGLDIFDEPGEDEPGETEVDRPGEEPAEPEDHQVSEAEDDPEQSEEAEEAEEGARSAVSTKAVRKVRSTKAPVKKSGVKTPSRKESRAKVTVEKRTTPFQFVRESVAELRKVVWPTRLQMQTYFVVVLVFVLFVIALVGLLDFGLGWALLRIFG